MNLSSTQDSSTSNQVMSGTSRPMPMKLFAAWGIDKTPSNCIPRLCTITINRILLFKSLGSDLKTAMIALKIQGSKRTIRSNEFIIIGHHQQACLSSKQQQNQASNLGSVGGGTSSSVSGGNTGSQISSSGKTEARSNVPANQQSLGISSNTGSNSLTASSTTSSSHISTSTVAATPIYQSSLVTHQVNPTSNASTPVLAIEIDLTFSLQYPHFLKKNVNFLQIMLQRRKRYKSRKILGFKTLAVGVINMAEVMQRRQKMDKELDLVCEMKGSHNKNEVVARIIMSSLKCQPIDQDSINRNMRFVGDRSVGGDVDTDDFSSNEEGSDSEMPIGRQTAKAGRASLEARAAINDRERSEHVVGQASASNTAGGASHQKNFKQKIIALVKKFRTDSDGFDNEQYEAALEQELMQAAASGQGSLAIEELLEEDDLDVDRSRSSSSESEPEWDEMSVSSTPKPSLRPFFSSTTLNKI